MKGGTYFGMGMTSYDSDFDSDTREPLLVRTDFDIHVFLSYYQRVIRLSPPPYDTNCRDYKSQGLVSKHSCFKNCLNNFTLGRYNAIFEDHVINRTKYLIRTNSASNSSSSL